MYATLIALTGPLKGASRELSDNEITIGRDASNSIPLPDVAVSRKHCAIRNENLAYRIVDLDSLNGTFVNGVPVNERLLKHGDRIEIGDSSFVFAQNGDAIADQATMEWSDDSPPSTIELTKAEALRHPSEEHLTLLFGLSEAIARDRNIDDLQKDILEVVAEKIPYARGAIVLTEGNQNSTYVRSRREGPALVISRTVVQKVIDQQIGVLSNRIGEGSDRISSSLMKSGSRSLICAPLETGGKSYGCLYLESNDPAVEFQSDHLRLAQSVGRIAAAAIVNAQHYSGLQMEVTRLRAETKIDHELVGASKPMQDVIRFLEKAAPADSTVFISGESGTGKELVARAIHRNSPRNNKAFVAINCATLTDTLLESELFGHEKGAFTGAIAQKKGKFEVADGGTIFLDEITELTPQLQAKLLRVLQEREIERIGATKPIRIDVRVLAATNRDLKERVKEGAFRSDLFYRLNVLVITMPPLRERQEDIGMLANYFVAKYGAVASRKIKGLAPETHTLLLHYQWPGNVRELENAIERAVVLGAAEWILPEDLPDSVLEVEPGSETGLIGKYHDALRQTKKDLILKALTQSAGNYTEAAKLLGIHPNYLHRLIRNLNLKSQIT